VKSLLVARFDATPADVRPACCCTLQACRENAKCRRWGATGRACRLKQ
jgi:hypothetical protein